MTIKESVDSKQLYTSVGKRVKQLREAKGMTQQEVADLCNFEKSNVSRIEAGRSNMTLKTMDLISRALKVQIKDLLTFE